MQDPNAFHHPQTEFEADCLSRPTLGTGLLLCGSLAFVALTCAVLSLPRPGRRALLLLLLLTLPLTGCRVASVSTPEPAAPRVVVTT